MKTLKKLLLSVIVLMILVLLLVINLVTAKNPYEEIIFKSNELKESTQFETAYQIDKWVHQNIDWEFNYYPQLIEVTFNTKRGDCTDIANLIRYMLQKQGIRVRIVHGYENNNKHDWYEFKYHGEWISFEKNYYSNLTRIEVGPW